MIISIGTDHGGYLLKEKIVEHLKDKYQVIDEGTYSSASTDYPIFAKKVAEDVRDQKADIGILICTNGVGMSIAANKVDKVRAALVFNTDTASHARTHNNANVICLGAVNQSPEKAIEYVDVFINSKFSNEERHARRVEEINKMNGGK